MKKKITHIFNVTLELRWEARARSGKTELKGWKSSGTKRITWNWCLCWLIMATGSWAYPYFSYSLVLLCISLFFLDFYRNGLEHIDFVIWFVCFYAYLALGPGPCYSTSFIWKAMKYLFPCLLLKEVSHIKILKGVLQMVSRDIVFVSRRKKK